MGCFSLEWSSTSTEVLTFKHLHVLQERACVSQVVHADEIERSIVLHLDANRFSEVVGHVHHLHWRLSQLQVIRLSLMGHHNRVVLPSLLEIEVELAVEIFWELELECLDRVCALCLGVIPA